MKKKLFYFLNLILILAIWVSNVCYAEFGGLWLKGLTSGFFVMLGAVNMIYALLKKSECKNFAIVMLVGFVFAMLGDIVLNIRNMFIYGALLFAVGHVFYFVAYCLLMKFKWTDLIAGVSIFVPSVLVITLVPIFDFGGIVMELVCVFYALIISLMLGKAISNFVRERSIMNLLVMIGSIFFFFSDLMLLFNVFGNLSAVFDVLCIATYYPAQAMLGFAVMFAPEKMDLPERHGDDDTAQIAN